APVEQLSVAVMLKVDIKLGRTYSQSLLNATAWLAGQVITGAMLSMRFTLNVQVEVLPAASVTVKVTVVVPTPETEVPAAGDCVTEATVQLSAAVASEV